MSSNHISSEKPIALCVTRVLKTFLLLIVTVNTLFCILEPEKPSIRGESINVESYDMQPVTVTVGSTLKVLEKTTVNIRCIASGIPEPSVYWDSSSSMQPANKFDVNQGGQLLTIREVDASDSGKYMCNAVNKAGEVTEAALVKVVGKSKIKWSLLQA